MCNIKRGSTYNSTSRIQYSYSPCSQVPRRMKIKKKSETLAIEARGAKLEAIYHSFKSISTFKYPSKNIRLRHYNSVVIHSVRYLSECLFMDRKNLLREMKLRKRKILMKIKGPIREEEGSYRMRHNNELYDCQQGIGDEPSKDSLPA